MHQIPTAALAITLFSRYGGVWHYPSRRAALQALGWSWIVENVAAHFCEFHYASGYLDELTERWVSEPHYRAAHFIMRDAFGDVVTAVDFDDIRARRKASRRDSLWHQWNGLGPVPGVRCQRGGGHYFRHPKSMAERRQAALVLKEEGEVPPRAARKANNLVSSWDDYRVAAREDRSWKRYRKTQWKVR